MNAARKDFYTDFAMENASDQGRLFRAAKKLLSKKEAPSFPNYLEKTALTNDIGRFFIRKIKTIRSNIDAVANSRAGILVPDDPEVGPDKELRTFQPLSECKVRDLIRKSAKKSCPLDHAPTSLVVSCLDILLNNLWEWEISAIFIFIAVFCLILDT